MKLDDVRNCNEMGKCWMQTWAVAVSDHSQLSGCAHNVDTPSDLHTDNCHSSPPLSPPSLATHTHKTPLNVSLVDNIDPKTPPAHPWEVESTWKYTTVRKLHPSPELLAW